MLLTHASVILDSGPKFQESEPLEALMRFPKSCLKKTGFAGRHVLVPGTNVTCPADDRLSRCSTASGDQGVLFPVKCERGAVLNEGAVREPFPARQRVAAMRFCPGPRLGCLRLWSTLGHVNGNTDLCLTSSLPRYVLRLRV